MVLSIFTRPRRRLVQLWRKRKVASFAVEIQRKCYEITVYICMRRASLFVCFRNFLCIISSYIVLSYTHKGVRSWKIMVCLT